MPGRECALCTISGSIGVWVCACVCRRLVILLYDAYLKVRASLCVHTSTN